jgi:hypothetical protein
LTTEPSAETSRSSDFFTLSGCRDLMFHVQEHSRAFRRHLATNHLTFVGFETPARSRYAELIPTTPMTDLIAGTRSKRSIRDFVGMYQFWVQRPAKAAVAVG